ncbi:4Fe-4S dicluster domain-containing protein [Desulfosudis oleivorans]|uniref:4Fe-4S ferredoxin iron-sulfur binding domain protein n=1 Tax=Desulfosudis oleivorans (strain DSM 6200 / JCM 39069 / Hxd3) TaxID=96561 RepID=A8ZY06_DESOH|nr:4Fe-4S dicluster domain-containing protein [Desulfosudis oleivorans]ABW68633.1 4Fe-4S ferredoxin iron-sulfur binding domain protein [Desulfosudis oleivorans Hxd3]
MIKRPFFGLAKPTLMYEPLDSTLAAQEIPAPAAITLLVDTPLENQTALQVHTGDAIAQGQAVSPIAGSDAYATAALGGTVSSVDAYTGNFGRRYTAVTVKVDASAAADDAFAQAGKTPSLEAADRFLRCVPGGLPVALFDTPDKIKTIVVCGVDSDLLCVTRQYVLKAGMDAILRGAEALKKMLGGAPRMMLTVFDRMAPGLQAGGLEIKKVGAAYPAANPRIMAKDLLGMTIPADTTCEAAGICFVSAEAVAALGKAYEKGRVPDRKIVTVVLKNGTKKLVSVVLGTPVGQVLSACSQAVSENDRLVLGGPLTGTAVYTESHPVGPDTDMIFVQGADQIFDVSENSCINCGDCVRICPARVPVNVLIRYLQAGEYGEAVDSHDLLSCIDCGLCSCVCPARIPIFQYIQLGKYEFARLTTAEADHAA